MENPFEALERKLGSRLDEIEALIKENLKPVKKFRVGGLALAVEVTGLKEQTIYKLVQKRKIPCSKPRGTRNIRFDEEKLIEWLKSGHNETEEEISEKTFDNIRKL